MIDAPRLEVGPNVKKTHNGTLGINTHDAQSVTRLRQSNYIPSTVDRDVFAGMIRKRLELCNRIRNSYNNTS